jgi:SAM-dependent methyltransferase
MIDDHEHGDIKNSFDFFIEQKFPQNCSILDIGCNVGSLLKTLHKFDYQHTCGVEISEAKLKLGRALNPEIRERLINADGSKLPFKDEAFQVVISFDTLEHIKDINAHLTEVKRVLEKPTGIYLFQTPNKFTNIPWEIINSKSLFKWKRYHCSLQTYRSLHRILRQNGFHFVKISKRDNLSEYNINKINRKLGIIGIFFQKIFNLLPIRFSSNYWVIAAELDLENGGRSS